MQHTQRSVFEGAAGPACAAPLRSAAYFQRQNELLLSAAGEGIYGLDLEGRVTFANPAAAHLTGHSPEELLGQRSRMKRLGIPTRSEARHELQCQPSERELR